MPKIKFTGVAAGGNLKVGNYHFYFKLSDADGNETDFVGESGLVSVFIGFNDPRSVTTGQANENSFKSVQFQISNIDTSYNYVYAYYSRYTADGGEMFNTEYVKISKKFVVNNYGVCNMLITGFEESIPISAADINLNYNVVDAAHTAATC
jgi:beta-glucanase (GH16 family)